MGFSAYPHYRFSKIQLYAMYYTQKYGRRKSEQALATRSNSPGKSNRAVTHRAGSALWRQQGRCFMVAVTVAAAAVLQWSLAVTTCSYRTDEGAERGGTLKIGRREVGGAAHHVRGLTAAP
jgi:hypothetical protein